MSDNSILRWRAPAKLNLFLHVTGRRDDGYHELQTLFQFLDYSDYLGFDVCDSAKIARVDIGHSNIDLPEEDLSVRAASLLQKHAKIKNGATIYLKKQIPAGGGLGGGSSDAATTLIALNQLWQANLSKKELLALGLSLGADVPVFIHGHASLAAGVGERLASMHPVESWYCVLIPQIVVSTAEIFSDSALTRDHPIKTIRGSLPSGYFDRFCNDLQPVTCRLFPQVARTLDWLKSFGNARMSGSGSSVFVAVGSKQEGLEILSKKPEACDGFVAKGLNIHPHYHHVVV